MDEKFQQIKRRYERFYRKFREKSQYPVADTEKGIWGYADTDSLFQFFKDIHLEKYGSFVDIGSGDGKVVLIAALFGVKAVGIEYDKDLIDVSNDIKQELNLDAEFIQGDYLEQNLSDYDIIFINPDKGFHLKVEEKLLKDMKDTTILYVYNELFQPRFLEKISKLWYNQIPVIEYRKR
ncbi:methyltransferase domain-containing protein [Candidatus Woesearchaeota archaeon]|nr:methyltransferase domain-containing protein [Candidatus Woesearchaeota archaeon]